MMAARTLLAAAVLLGYLAWRLGWATARADLRAAWRHCLVLGVLNAAVPFWLIAWGEKHIDSGLAAVVQASVPIFNALIILRVLPHERLSGVEADRTGHRHRRRRGRHRASIPTAVSGRLRARSRSSLSSLSYAGAGVYGQLAVSGTAGPVLAAGSMLVGGLILLPFALFQLPDHAPSAEAIASLLALTLLGTVPRPARPLPDARAARVGAALARDLPHARLRARLRRAHPRRGDLARDARRAGADPRRHRARLRRRPAAAAARRTARGEDPARAARAISSSSSSSTPTRTSGRSSPAAAATTPRRSRPRSPASRRRASCS